MAHRVTTADLKINFVEKLPGEVGDGTGWVPITLAQLAEVAYRVRKTQLTTATATVNITMIYTQGELVRTRTSDITLSLGAGAIPAPLISATPFIDNGGTTRYVWCLYGGATTTPLTYPTMDEVNSFGSGRLAMAGTQAENFFGPRYIVSGDDHVATREPISELALWTTYDYDGANFRYTVPAIYFDLDCRYGEETDPISNPIASLYSGYQESVEHRSSVPPAGTDDDWTTLEGVRIRLEPRVAGSGVAVAFVGAASPLDPAASLYLRLEFSTSVSPSGLGNDLALIDIPLRSRRFVNSTPEFPVSNVLVGNCTINLSTSSIQFPVYAWIQEFRFIAPPTITASCNFVFDVTEWWPSAKDNPAAPVWDTATGAKL